MRVIFFRDLWEANFHRKRTYSLGVMNFFSFRTHMGQLGQHQKNFISFFQKKLKITPNCLDFYKHAKL